MKTLAFPVVLLALAAAVRGQVAHTATTRGTVMLTAFGGGAPGTATLPAGADVSEGFSLFTQTGSGDCVTALNLASSSGEIALSCWCGAQWPGAQSRLWPVEIVARITASSPLAAMLALEVDVQPYAVGGGAGGTGSAAIDVDDNGTLELVTGSGSASTLVARTLGTTPLVVRFAMDGRARDLDQVNCLARRRVLNAPLRYSILEAAQQWPRCAYGRLLLHGDAQNRGFWMAHDMSAPAVYALGVQPARLPLVGACVLHLQPVLVLPAPIQQSLLVPTPSWLRGTVLVEAFGFRDQSLTGTSLYAVSML